MAEDAWKAAHAAEMLGYYPRFSVMNLKRHCCALNANRETRSIT